MRDEDFWDPERLPFPHWDAPTAEQIRTWEEQHGVRLPSTLAHAQTIQDGGCVRGTDMSIDPLRDFSRLSDPSLWENVHFEFNDRDEEELDKLIHIGSTATGLGVVLDGNAEGEARILFLGHDLGREIRDEGDIAFDDLVASERRLVEGDGEDDGSEYD